MSTSSKYKGADNTQELFQSKEIKAGNGGIIRNKYKGRINKALLIDG